MNAIFSNACRRAPLLFTALTLMLAFGAATSAQAQVRPFVDCVERVDDSNYRAYFGYVNTNSTAVTLFTDTPRNFFTPIPDAPGQPEVFAPGVHRRVVAVVLPLNTNETWFLGESFAQSAYKPEMLCGAGGTSSRSFTYQGRLTDNAAAANGDYDLRFQIFNAAANGTAQSATLDIEDVRVTNGVFTVSLDFGLNPAFLNAGNSFLEIGVRAGISTDAFTTLAPRQPVTAVPLAMRANTADSAFRAVNTDNAINAQKLGGTAADQFVRTNDARLSDARQPAAGSTNYIQNTTTQQTANFNVSGNGTIGGTLTATTATVNGFRARGGAPGSFGGDNNGYAFSGNNGDNDSGLFSTADGQVSLFADTFERLRVTSGGVLVTDSLFFSSSNNNRIFYNVDINGLQFSSGDHYQWFSARNNRVNMALYSNGNLSIFGSYGQLSDARYKTNVQTFADVLDRIRRLRGVTFNWKPDLNNPERQIGFIAQEVEAVFPELVSTNEEGYKTVSYANAVPVLVEAVKEQQTQIERQQKQIDELKRIVCAMKPDTEVCRKEEKQ